MKHGHWRTSIVILLFLLLCAGNAMADKGVFGAKVTPHELLANTPTTITVTAEIATGDYYITSVSAYQTTAEGQPIASLGQMFDDGVTGGDEREADTVFTMQFTVDEPNQTKIYVRVTAAYYRDRNRYLSPVLEINIAEQVPLALVEDTLAAIVDIEDQFQSSLASQDIETARQNALNNALNDPDITDADLFGSSLSLLYRDRIRGIASLKDPNAMPTKGVGSAVPQDIPPTSQFPTSDTILIYAPFYGGQYHTDNADSAQDQFNGAVYMTFDPQLPNILQTTQASLDYVKQWGNYGTIIIDSHGDLYTAGGENLVVIDSGTPVGGTIPPQLQLDLDAGRVGISSSGNYFFAPSYIDEYITALPNTFFWLGTCDSLTNGSLWTVLQNKGAKVAFGWSGDVTGQFDNYTFPLLIGDMVPNDAGIDPLSALETLNALSYTTDPTTGATLQLNTETDWEDFVFFQGGITNGDFESGDWTGWTHGGENGQTWQLILGAHVHSGTYAASLGRWDTEYIRPYEAPGLEPEGYEWFYQDIVVPNNVTYLRFSWWMETWDTANWDWFDAYIQDTSGNTLATIVSHEGKPGLDYGYYWTSAEHIRGDANGWVDESFDVSAYRGQEIRLYFDQRLDGWGDQQRVYVDDIRLE